MNAEPGGALGTELVLVGAADTAGLLASIRRLVLFLEQAPGVELSDVAYTCARDYAANRGASIAVVASSVMGLRARLVSAEARIAADAARVRDKSGTYYFRDRMVGAGTEGRLAFVFPGAPSFYPGMVRDLSVRFRVCRMPFDELEAALKGAGAGKFVPSAFVFPPAPYYRHDADVFTAGGYAEAMVSTYSANAALYRMFAELGIRPDGVTGFAGGDLSALAAGGLFGKFERKDRLGFLRDMYKLVNTAVDHAGLPRCVMVSTISPHPGQAEEVLAQFPPEKVAVALYRSPRHLTIAIAPEAVEEVQQALSAAGVRGMRLAVDRPFNTPWCGKILSQFRKFAGNWVDDRPRIPVYSCGTTEPLPPKARKARDAAAGQWVAPVRLEQTVRRMYADGFRVFLECGPRGATAGEIDDILRGEDHVAVAADSVHRAGLLQLQHVVGQLAALGVAVEPAALFVHRRCRALDFDAPLTLDVRRETEQRLSRVFPRLSLEKAGPSFGGAMVSSAASVPGERPRAGARAAAVRARERARRQFDFGAFNPLISDADVVAEQPGVSLEIRKTFDFAQQPIFADFARGVSRLSYSDRRLRGFTPLALVAAAEIMAELAQKLLPSRRVARVEDLLSRRTVAFKDDRLTLHVRAERVPSSVPAEAAVKVQVREDGADAAWTWPACEGTFILAEGPAAAEAFTPPELSRAREVHWAPSDIYPDRLFSGERLQAIRSADRWSEGGLDYEVEVPSAESALAFTRVPQWALNPQLLAAITDGFTLWRSHRRFEGAFSFGFRLRRLELHAPPPAEGTRLHCYLRTTGVTPRSVLADIQVSDGNGTRVMELRGYEELAERVPPEYRALLLAPAQTFLTSVVPAAALGAPATTVASAMVSDVPYPLFERNEELWLKTVSQIVLNHDERRAFAEMPGAVSRRTEWLFGRITAKEAVRRFLAENYQARWSDADVQIWADDSGKPCPIGEWGDRLTAHIDLSIAHTSRFVVAVVAANARVGVDVEALGRDLSDEFTNGVFNPEERELAVRAVDAPSATIRFWCAKEALSKALGTGIRYSPKDLVVESFQAETGEMALSLRGQWLENFKMFTGRSIRVSSAVVKGHVLASCFIPESLFG